MHGLGAGDPAPRPPWTTRAIQLTDSTAPLTTCRGGAMRPWASRAARSSRPCITNRRRGRARGSAPAGLLGVTPAEAEAVRAGPGGGKGVELGRLRKRTRAGPGRGVVIGEGHRGLV